MAIIRCPECGHEISDKAPFCPSCGVAIANKVVTCPECGKTYFSTLKECPQCHHLTQTVSRETVDTLQQKIAEQEQQIAEQEPQQQEETHGSASNGNKVIIGVVIAAALIVAGISYYFYSSSQTDREMQAYEYAMSSSDPQVLQGYLDQYLSAPTEHRDSIQSHLDKLKMADQEWTNAIVSGSKTAIESYLQTHPDSPFKAMAIHKIDSIDWAAASRANTVEAMETYIAQHPEGDHIEEANNTMNALNSTTVKPEEQQMVGSVMQTFFQSLNNRDEDALTSAVAPLLKNFLGKTNATRADVATFMRKIYKSDVASMAWQQSGEMTIGKKENGEQKYDYTVGFSALQTVTLTDGSTDETSYKVSAVVNSDGRISELNLVKIIE